MPANFMNEKRNKLEQAYGSIEPEQKRELGQEVQFRLPA